MTTCDDVRPLLTEHVLAALEDPADLAVRRHLRGCAGCRRELDALREGVEVFAATLERPAPDSLNDRVLEVLSEEWTERPVLAPPRPSAGRGWPLAVAASVALAVIAGAFGIVQMGRARDAGADAEAYRTVLATLGGTGFRVGALEPAGIAPVSGSVVAYESSHDQSFVVVFVRAPGLTGDGAMLVSRSDGTTRDQGPIEFDGDGDAAAWWVSDRSISSITGLTVTAPDGSALATARVAEA